jgi:hypothetical protein
VREASLMLGPWERAKIYLSAGVSILTTARLAVLVDDGAGGQACQRPPLLV